MKRFHAVALAVFLLCLVSCQNTGENFEGISIPYVEMPAIREDFTAHQDNSTPCNNDNPDFLAYDTETKTFDSIRSMKAELEKNPPAINISFCELHGLQSTYSESLVEWAGETDYFIYYTNEDKVVAFMPFESENNLTTVMNDWLGNSGTYEGLLENKLVHDVVKTEIPTDYGISYTCTYNTSVMTGLKIRYYEHEDFITGRKYILSVDLSPDDIFNDFMLFVFDKDRSFMCCGTAPDISLETASELYSVAVE